MNDDFISKLLPWAFLGLIIFGGYFVGIEWLLRAIRCAAGL